VIMYRWSVAVLCRYGMGKGCGRHGKRGSSEQHAEQIWALHLGSPLLHRYDSVEWREDSKSVRGSAGESSTIARAHLRKVCTSPAMAQVSVSSGAKALIFIGPLNVRAEARTLPSRLVQRFPRVLSNCQRSNPRLRPGPVVESRGQAFAAPSSRLVSLYGACQVGITLRG